MSLIKCINNYDLKNLRTTEHPGTGCHILITVMVDTYVNSIFFFVQNHTLLIMLLMLMYLERDFLIVIF